MIPKTHSIRATGKCLFWPSRLDKSQLLVRFAAQKAGAIAQGFGLAWVESTTSSRRG